MLPKLPQLSLPQMLAIAGGSILVLLVTCSAPQPTVGVIARAGQVIAALPTVTPPQPEGIFGWLSGAQPTAASISPNSAIVGQAQASGAPTPTFPPGSGPEAPPLSPLGQQFDSYVTGLLNAQQFHGTVLVARDGKILLAKGYGPYDTDQPLLVRSRMRLASVSKQFTAMGVVQLAARGKINIDFSVCTYIKDCPPAWKLVTIKTLLNHTSGLVDYTDFVSFDAAESQATTPAELMSRFRDQPLIFTPGEMYDYCNSNYVLLGMVIEQVSGQPYAQYMRDNIFAPLQMWDTGFDTSHGNVSGVSAGYISFWNKSTFLDASTLFSAGGLYSTVEDLYRWDQALYREDLAPKEWMQQIFTPGHGSYGFGWKIEQVGGRKRISHAGNMTGVYNFIARYPNDKLTVIVLSNMQYGSAEAVASQLASIALR